ncbi:hypothetical protein BDW71DRAFT_210091 [Aspergillus fruticulosus]
MANYLWAISGHAGSDWQIKGTALACYSLATLGTLLSISTLLPATPWEYDRSWLTRVKGAGLIFDTKYAYWFFNAVSVVKFCTLLFVIVTGFDAWSGSSTATAYGFTIALHRIIFSYGGYNNVFNVANEVKNPVKSLKLYATAALTTVLFFSKVFGDGGSLRGPNFLIALSSFGNIIAHVAIIFNILAQAYQLIMPWYLPDGGQYAGDVSFWYATYAVTGMGIFLACAFYYALWAYFLSKWKGYELRQELITLDDGAQDNRLRKIPNEEVEEWDAVHDAAGRLIDFEHESQSQQSVDEVQVEVGPKGAGKRDATV